MMNPDKPEWSCKRCGSTERRSSQKYPRCRPCAIRATARWAAANKERSAANRRAWKDANAEKVREYHASYYQANKDRAAEQRHKRYLANRARHLEQGAKWRETNRDKIAARARERYAANPEPVKQRMAAWVAEHPEQNRAHHRASVRRKRAAKYLARFQATLMQQLASQE